MSRIGHSGRADAFKALFDVVDLGLAHHLIELALELTSHVTELADHPAQGAAHPRQILRTDHDRYDGKISSSLLLNSAWRSCYPAAVGETNTATARGRIVNWAGVVVTISPSTFTGSGRRVRISEEVRRADASPAMRHAPRFGTKAT